MKTEIPSFNSMNAKILEGKRLLKQNQFPDELIESVADIEARRSLVTRIFSFDISYKDIDTREQKYRNMLLVLRLKHADYLSSKNKFRPMAVLVFVVGFITFVTAAVGLNTNMPFALFSLISGAILYFLDTIDQFVKQHLFLITIITATSILLEYIALGWPQTYLEIIYHLPNQIAGRLGSVKEGAVVVLFNESTPIIYLCVRVMSVLVMLNIFLKQRIYLREKNRFETEVVH